MLLCLKVTLSFSGFHSLYMIEYLSNDVRQNNKAYSKKQGFSDIRELINRAFCDFQEYDYYRADSVTQEEIRSFYDRRTESLMEWLDSDEQEHRYSEQERQFLTDFQTGKVFITLHTCKITY